MSLPIEVVDDFVFSTYLQNALTGEGSPTSGMDASEVMAALDSRRGPERYLDFLLRAGPYGDHFGKRPDGLSLAALEDAPHGIDLGPLEPRFPGALATPNQRIDLAPEPILADVPRLEAALAEGSNGELLLVGRRQVRSNNSWTHNIDVLVKGKPRCILEMPAPAVSKMVGQQPSRRSRERSMPWSRSPRTSCRGSSAFRTDGVTTSPVPS